MAMTLLTTNTATNDATSSFTSSIDSTYKLYVFKYYDVNPVTDGQLFQFQVNAAGESGYNEVATTTFFKAEHAEADGGDELAFQDNEVASQDTVHLTLTRNIGSGADESAAGTLWLFNPSNTTYVKHFYGRAVNYYHTNIVIDSFSAGYFNITAAITSVNFQVPSGNMDAVIKMYGVG